MYKFNLPAFKARHRAALALVAVGLTCPVFGWVQESHNKELPLVLGPFDRRYDCRQRRFLNELDRI